MKILQFLGIQQIGIMTSEAHHEAQYGFTAGTNFLQCSILRETVSRYAHFNNKKTYVISTDVSMAFNKTLRWISLFNIAANGESGQLLKFSKACYTNTNFFIKSKDTSSRVISEEIGEAQGNLYSPGHFIQYSLPLQNMIQNAGVMMDFEGVKINNHVVADDQINLAKDRIDFQVISELFQYYQKIYKLQFGWAKTELNIYGTQDPDADAKEVMFGGHRMKLSEGYTHLGLLVTNDIKNTDSINVSL